ncbi:hypothetical protein [Paraglaciecola chathamensis]|jgi:hypothetical protein|uniref:Uncharacterized protein n=1 Tax=Paraglaciecola chathamensis TaxID=368405 RepID=A0A8H9M2N9_9ALTE|nr:hypothetical protein [Paraglaciecola oceanifecundans]GGZ77788.1 hypothetical protein GCM10011274_39910 [Paraglaciecola oceanifecundans]|tara:strand:- start:216 stop:932 length:717 start_codon:yes stop_codon:yes gene_type:complete
MANFPDDSIQFIVEDDDGWWNKNTENKVVRGSLIWAFVYQIDQLPYTFVPISRAKAREHDTAIVEVTELKIGEHLQRDQLPVAGMATYSGECWVANKAKLRPCIVWSPNCTNVPRDLIKGKPKGSTAPTYLVVPFYGVDTSNGRRAGYSEEFVKRVRHCEYPQFHWDIVPDSKSSKESILRLDHMQPIGAHGKSYRLTEYVLSEAALEILDDQYTWLSRGGLPAESLILDYQELMQAF